MFYGTGNKRNGSYPVTGEQTNQRAELTAVICCLRHSSEPVHIATDSWYVCQGVRVWLAEWKSLGWRRRIGKRRTAPINNLDLWKALDSLWSKAPPGHLSISWVKGHANHRHVAAGITTELDAWGNARADELACRA